MRDHAQALLQDIHARVPTGLRVRTWVMTTEGAQVVVGWDHRSPAGDLTPCIVTGHSLFEALRRVAHFEEEYAEAGSLPQEDQ